MSAETTNDLSSVDGKVSQYAAFESSSDRYAMRLSGSDRNAGNTMTPAGEIPNSQYHDFNINGSLGVQTFDNQSVFFSYQRSQAENTGIPGGAPLGASAAARYTLAKRELFGLEYVIPNLRPDLPLITIRLSHQDIDRNVEIIQTPYADLYAACNTRNNKRTNRIKNYSLRESSAYRWDRRVAEGFGQQARTNQYEHRSDYRRPSCAIFAFFQRRSVRARRLASCTR